MTEKTKEAGIDPIQLNRDSRFTFKCRPGVKCFTKCCRGTNIVLTPYDVIRLKNRLQLDSEQFLTIYTKPELLEKTDLPIITLKMLEDEDSDEGSCPFVRDDGCLVYTDRPSSCRYYPLGVASLSHKEGADEDDFYFFVNEPHCLGFEEDARWTVRAWRQDQGVDIHDEINAEWTDLLVRKRSYPKNVMLTEQAKQMFFMVSYNIEKLREFVFESSFLDRYEVDEATVSRIKEDEVALLQFGIRWLNSLLFKQGGFKQREPTA